MSDVYTRLREFMDNMPVGYPETPTGVEIKILKKLYTPDEEELTRKLKNEPEEVPVTAKRIGADEKELAEKLKEMAQKGLIYRARSGDKKLYQAFQFIVGVYEFQLKRLDKEFCELCEEYSPYIAMSLASICPVHAITLQPKPGMEAPPKDLSNMLNRIATERGVA